MRLTDNSNPEIMWHYNSQHWVSTFIEDKNHFDCCCNKMYDDEDHKILLYAALQCDYVFEGEVIQIIVD